MTTSFVLGLFSIYHSKDPASAGELFHGGALPDFGAGRLSWISVPAIIVEPLIAASIVFIALDNLGSIRLERWRLLIVALFGLLHGLGFAAVLSELTLPAGSFMTSLLLFNVGVELGQIAVLILAALTVEAFVVGELSGEGGASGSGNDCRDRRLLVIKRVAFYEYEYKQERSVANRNGIILVACSLMVSMLPSRL